MFSFMIKPVCDPALHLLFYSCISISVYALETHVFQPHNEYVWGREGKQLRNMLQQIFCKYDYCECV